MSNSFSPSHLTHARIAYALGVVITLLCVCLCMGLGVKSAYAVSPGFTQWGSSTVEWKVENDTKLIIQPLDNAPEGTMPNVYNRPNENPLPWNNQKESITTVEFKGSIKSSESLYGLFRAMTSLESIDFGNFDTSQATDMRSMFRNCPNLTSLDLSSFDTSNVWTMVDMFFGCANLTSLDLSSFNTSNVTNMLTMFFNCYSLATIYVGSGWNTSKVSTSSDMFSNSFNPLSNLQGGNGTRYDDFAPTDRTRAHIDAPGNPGYLTLGYEVTPPSVSSLTYGETPSFEGGSVTFGQNRGAVQGTWSLDPRAPKPQAGDTSLSLVFTPNDSRYQKYRTNHTTITIPQVSKRPITGVTPESDQSKQYNGQAGADPTLTYEPSGLIDGDTKQEVFTGSLTRQDGYLPGQYDIGIGTLNLNTDGKGKNYSFDRTNAFTTGVTFTIKPKGSIPVPKAVDNLVYNGTEQTGVNSVEHVELTGVTAATDASDNYQATATPEDGYVWSDTEEEFDHSSKTINWSISPLPITVQAKNAESTFNEPLASFDYTVSPALPTTDTQDQVFTGSLACSVTSTSNPGEYKITKGDLNLNTQDKGKNYSFDPGQDFTRATYTLNAIASIAVPKAVDNLVYNGTEQTGVNPVEHVDLTDNKAIDASDDYQATATLEEGYMSSACV